jgi:hypothetical protein
MEGAASTLAVLLVMIVVQLAWSSSLRETMKCAKKALEEVGKPSSSSRHKFGMDLAIRVYDVIWDVSARAKAVNGSTTFNVVLLDTPDAHVIYRDISDGTIGQIIVDKTVMDVVSVDVFPERQVRIVAKYGSKGGMVYGLDMHLPSSGLPRQYLERDTVKQHPMIAPIIGLPKRHTTAKKRSSDRIKKRA